MVKAAEKRMWEWVGQQVRQSPQQVGEVVLNGSDFSQQGNGKFLVVASEDAMRVRDSENGYGLKSLIAQLTK